MAQRPSALVAGVVLSLVIGLSGLGVGLTFLGASLGESRPEFTVDVIRAGFAMGFAIGGYGLVVVLGAIGVWLRKRIGWLVALAVLGLGFVTLVGLTLITSLDDVLLGGAAIWGVAIALLVAPSTRAAVR